MENASNNVTEDSENSTELLRHNDVVEYRCNDGYISDDLPIRTCSRGKILPSFKTKPFTCIGRKILYKIFRVFTFVKCNLYSSMQVI